MNPRPRVTIREMAAVAQVSVATVSKVLDCRSGVAEATSERVNRLIQDMGHEAGFVARWLRSHETNVIELPVTRMSAQVGRAYVRCLRGRGIVATGDPTSSEVVQVSFTVRADLTSSPDREGHRVVELGPEELRVSASGTDGRAVLDLAPVRGHREIRFDRRLQAEAETQLLPAVS